MSHKVDGAVIKVRRQWNRGRRIATYRLRDISELRWGRMSGGLRHRTPQLFVHGYVMCDAMIAGTLAHSCAHGPGPHRIKVCLVRKGNESVWKDVLAVVGPRPDRAGRGAPAPIRPPMNLPYAQDPQARSSSADGAGGKGQRMHHEGDDAVVEVRQEWNDWRIATYRLRDVSELQWSWRGGGTKRRTPQPFVHGYVMCDEKIGGELVHVCSPGAPHRLKVCLTRKGNDAVWKEIATIVGPRPDRTPRRRRRRRARSILPTQEANRR